VNRRQFLQRAGALGGAALVGGPTLLSGRATAIGRARRGEPRPLLDLPANESPIDTVVVVMMENRSFDHYFGWLAGDERYVERGRSRYGERFRVNGKVRQAFTGPDGAEYKTAPWLEQVGEASPYQGCFHTDPGHGWDQGRAQRDGGFLADGSGNDTYALGYYEADAIPFLSRLAREFTVFDRWHCSVLAATYPNRAYLLAAQSEYQNNTIPTATGGYQTETVYDRLAAAGATAANYASDLPPIALWGERLQQFSRPIDAYFADAEAGTLPNVAFVDPPFLGPNQADDHPHADIRGGQRFLRDVFRGFAESPQWRSGLFVITYDEWGGFFDHVAPPVLPDDHASPDDLQNFGQAGFRVPTVLASPYARRGYVDRHLYDHTSVLRFIEWRFLGAPATGPGRDTASWFLTARDRNARNMGASLVDAPDREVGFDLALTLDPPLPPCAPGHEPEDPVFPPAAAATTPTSGEAARPKSTFELALDAGYFEHVGYDVTPSLMTREWGPKQLVS
jgi:phospholipase C